MQTFRRVSVDISTVNIYYLSVGEIILSKNYQTARKNTEITDSLIFHKWKLRVTADNNQFTNNNNG